MGIIKAIRKLKDPGSVGEKRSSQWGKVRAEHLKNNPACAVCGNTKGVEVHHIVPFHLNPEKELDPTNLITLCRKAKCINCHLCVGHCGSFKSYNPIVEESAKYISDMLKK